MDNEHGAELQEAIDCINDFAVTGNPQKGIDYLNRLLQKPSATIRNQLMQLIIVNCQLFGFQKYDKIRIDENLFCDWQRVQGLAKTYQSKQLGYLNLGQLSLLEEIGMNKKIFIAAPTSFGKTSLVAEYIINNREHLNDIIYVLPTNALIEELYEKLININKKYTLSYSISTIPDPKIRGDRILLLTPERFLALNQKYVKETPGLIVMDEVNKIMRPEHEQVEKVNLNVDRSARFRRVAEIIASSDAKCIFLSPYTYELDPSMQDFLRTHSIKAVNRRTDYILHESYDVSTWSKMRKVFNCNKNARKMPDNITAKTVALLRLLDGQQNIVYISGPAPCEKLVNALPESELPNMRVGVSPEDIQRAKSFIRHLETKYSADGLKRWKVVTAIQKGIGIHMAPMPRYIKKEMIKLFNKKVIQKLIVTTSFVEGVNTNTANIIITSRNAGSVRLGNVDLLNIMGRAGRFGCTPVGRIFAIKPDVFHGVEDARNSTNRISNSNYENAQYVRSSYDIETVKPRYLNQLELVQKQALEGQRDSLGLKASDLNIAQNVSPEWKIALYSYLQTIGREDINKLAKAVANIVCNENTDDYLDGIRDVFNAIRQASEYSGVKMLEQQKGEQQPFDRQGSSFIWGIRYERFLKKPMSQILATEKRSIDKRLKEAKMKYSSIAHTSEFRKYLQDSVDSWLMRYLGKDDNVNDERVYDYVFHFISSVIEYKIPLYINFFTEIFKLFVVKEHSDIEAEVTSMLEKTTDGQQAETTLAALEQQSQLMLDYGFPSELIEKFRSKKIIIKKDTDIYDEDTFQFIDDYECLMLIDYIRDVL